MAKYGTFKYGDGNRYGNRVAASRFGKVTFNVRAPLERLTIVTFNVLAPVEKFASVSFLVKSYAGALEYDVLVYDKTGNKLGYLREATDISFEYLRIGGMGIFSLNLPRDFDDLHLIALDNRIEIWINSELWYSGFVLDYNPALDNPEKIQLVGAGYWEQTDNVLINKGYLGLELSVIARDILDSEIVPNTQITYNSADVQTTGFVADELEFSYHPAREAFRMLEEISLTHIWGVNEQRKFFFKPAKTTVERNFMIGKDVKSFFPFVSRRDIVNRLFVQGGALGSGGNYIKTIDRLDSQATFGLREKPVSNSVITTDAVADRWAQGILDKSAYEARRANLVVLENYPRRINADGKVQVLGSKDGYVHTYPVNSVRYAITHESLLATLDLGSPRPNLSSELRRLNYDLGNYRRLSAQRDDALASAVAADQTIPGQATVASINNVASNDGINRVKLTWNQVTLNVDGSACNDMGEYWIFKGTDPAALKRLATTDAGTREWTDAGLIFGQALYYAVKAVDKWGNQGAMSAVQNITAGDITAPATPTGLVATGQFQKIALSWNQNSEADFAGYNIYESTDNVNFTFLAFVKGRTYTRGQLGNEVARYYKIQAEDKNGNTSGMTASVGATTTKPVAGDIQINTWYGSEDIPTIFSYNGNYSVGSTATGWGDIKKTFSYNTGSRERKVRIRYNLESSANSGARCRITMNGTEQIVHEIGPGTNLFFDEWFWVTPNNPYTLNLEIMNINLNNTCFNYWFEVYRQNTVTNTT